MEVGFRNQNELERLSSLSMTEHPFITTSPPIARFAGSACGSQRANAGKLSWNQAELVRVRS